MEVGIMETIVLSGTTDASTGAITITSTNGGATGYIEKIVYDWTDAKTTTDLVFTAEEAGVSVPLMTITNAATGDTVWYPRTPANTVAAGAAFTNWADKIFVADSEFKVAVTDAGTSKTMRFVVYVSD